jgi:phosphohistidine phosphatase SixA
MRLHTWLLAGLAVATIGQAESLSGSPLVAALQHGGFVLVMRHASSPAAPPAKASADPQNVRLERQLDTQGRETASSMGESLRRLRITLGPVLSSPTFRARQTVMLAGLGEPRTVPELDASSANMMQAGADGRQSDWLRHEVGVSPPAHSNTLIVTHAPNIIGAFGEQATGLADGETLIFRPDGRGGASLVARVKIEDWPRLRAAQKW